MDSYLHAPKTEDLEEGTRENPTIKSRYEPNLGTSSRHERPRQHVAQRLIPQHTCGICFGLPLGLSTHVPL
jgi:hypothetical protein